MNTGIYTDSCILSPCHFYWITISRSSHWEVFCKKGVFGRFPYCGHCLNCSGEKVYSHRRRFFFTHVILPEIRIGSFSHEFRCSGARNKFRAGVLSRIFSYSTEHLHSVHLLSYCGSLSVSSLRRKRTSQFSQEARTYYKRTRHYPRKK